MKMSFKQACSVVATLYEAAPETYCSDWFWQNASGIYLAYDDPEVCRWCAIGGVALATSRHVGEIGSKLDRFVFPGDQGDQAHTVSDRGIEHAIRLLRLAAGEVE